MENFRTEFHSITESYHEAGKVLAWIAEMDDSQPSTLVRSVLENQDCIDQIDRMHSKVIQLAGKWKQNRRSADARTWEEIDRLADGALQQAKRLNQLCSITMTRLQSAKNRLGAELAEIGKGERFVKSAYPSKNNFPKFIDTEY